jgi:hypothetical protein
MVNKINGNTGNSYITYAILKTLGRCAALKKKDHISNIWNDELPDPGRINSDFNMCLFTLQDQLQRTLPNYVKKEKLAKITEFLKRIKIPVVSYSLGTNEMMTESRVKRASILNNIFVKKRQKIAHEFKAFLEVISEKSASLGIRGYITMEELARIGIHNATVIGCPTYFENGEKQEIIKKKLTDVSPILGAGLFASREVNPLIYICQSEKIGLKICHGAEISPNDISEIYQSSLHYPGYANCFIQALRRDKVKAFCNMDDWKRFIQTEKIELSVGTRVHGSIMAMNAGVPAVCTAGDSRALEMCSYLGMPHMSGALGLHTPLQMFHESFNPLSVKDKYLEVFKTYKSWLVQNSLLKV